MLFVAFEGNVEEFLSSMLGQSAALSHDGEIAFGATPATMRTCVRPVL